MNYTDMEVKVREDRFPTVTNSLGRGFMCCLPFFCAQNSSGSRRKTKLMGLFL